MTFGDTAESNLSRRLSLIALVCCVVSSVIAILALLAYLPGMSLLGSVFPDYIPMAPSTALSFIFLSIILTVYRYRSVSGILHTGCLFIAALVSLFGLLKFGEHFINSGSSFENLFVPALDKLGDIPVGIMSYTTGLGFFIAGIGVLCYTLKYRLRKVLGWVGFAVGASGGFVTLYSTLMLFGYIYREPFLYGEGSIVPMALTTAVAFLFLGIGIIMANGPGQLFTRFLAGNSTRSRLLRVFVPLTIFIILVKEIIDFIIVANAATLMTSTLLVFIGITTMVVYWFAGVIGRKIDSAEDNLRESERKFRGVFNQAAMGVARLAPDGTWLNVNKKLCDIVGYSHKELLSKTFQDITHPDDLEIDLEYVHQLLSDEIQTYSMEKRYLKKNGDFVWINLTVSLVRDSDNDPDYFISVIEDISDRKLAEVKLQKSEVDLREAQSIAKMGRWELDLVSNKLQWSDSIFQIFEIDPEHFEASYESFIEAIHPDDRERVNRAYTQSLTDKTPYEITHRLLMKDGRVKWLNERCQTEYDLNGKAVRSIGIVQDITERKQTEMALRASELMLKESEKLANVGSWNWEVKPDIVKWSDELFRITQQNPELPPPIFSAHSKLYTPESWELLSTAVGKALKDATPYDLELDMIRPDDKIRTVHTVGRAIQDDTGSVIRLWGMVQDITERKLIEKALRESNENFQQVVSNITTAVWKADIGEDGTFEDKYTSPVFDELLGLPAGGGWDDHLRYIKPEYQERVNVAFREAIESPGKIIDLDFEVLKDNGQTAWFNSKGRCFEKDGKLHIFGSTMDITKSKLAEIALRESNEKYLNLMDSLGTGVVLHAPDSSIILSNPKASEILGISSEQLKGKKAIDPRWRFVKNDGTDMPLEEYPVNKALSSMKSFSEYFVGIKCPDRKYITWVNVNASLVLDDNKDIKYVTISFNDVTEQKQAEKAVKESEERLNLIIDTSPIGICTVDPLGNFSSTNRAYEQMLGYSKEECSNLSFFDVTHPNDRPMNKKLFQSMFTLKTTGFAMKKRYIRKDGSQIDVAVHAIGIMDSAGNVRFGTAFVNDITERKRAEEALRESEAKLNALFTSLTEMVVMHELVLNEAGEAIDYRITDCNDVFTEVTGIRKEDAIGKLASEVYQTDPPPYLERFAKVALGGDPQEFNSFYPPLDKHFMISVVSPQAGKFATITTDITAMMQIQEMIVAKNREMENYLYVASHDLRTPLVNIQGFSQRLKNQADSIKNLFTDKTLEPEMLHELGKITDEDMPKTLSFVLSNIEKMDTLINGLLTLSRTGTVEMNIQKIDMNTLFAKIIKNLDFQIKEAQCKIHINSLPGCYGDAALLDQLFTNILSNALKYSDSERVLEISIDAKNVYNRVVYTIRDTGKGIAQKHLGRIWNVFFRIDPRSGKTGEGLGLSLVKRIVEKHKGKVWAESEENKGSVFYIELPNRAFSEI